MIWRWHDRSQQPRRHAGRRVLPFRPFPNPHVHSQLKPMIRVKATARRFQGGYLARAGSEPPLPGCTGITPVWSWHCPGSPGDKENEHASTMTKALPFTKANIKRRIDAAHEAGLIITAISPDGTLLLTAVDVPVPDRKALDEVASAVTAAVAP